MFFSHQHLEIEIGNVKLKQYWKDQCTAVRFAQGFRSERSALAPRHGSRHTPRKSIHTQLKQYWNDQCGSVRTGLSVRTLAPRHGSGHHGNTHTIKSGDLTPFLRHWSFQDKTVLKRPVGSVRTGLLVRTLGARATPPFRTSRNTETHNQIWRPHSVPTSLVVQDQI